MRAALVVFHPPALQQDARFGQGAKEFPIQKLTAQLIVEAFDVAVLPWTSWFDVESFNLSLLKPVLDGISDKLRAVVTAQMLWRTVARNRRFNYGNGIDCSDRPRGVDGQTLARAFIEQGEDAETRSVLGLVLDKIPTPHFSRLTGPQPLALLRSKASHPSLLLSHLDAFQAAQALYAFGVDH